MGRPALGAAERRWRMGAEKAQVLPVPVLGAAQHVPSRQRGGDGLFLNGGGLLVALLLQCVQDGTYEAQVFKFQWFPSFFKAQLRIILQAI